MDIFLGVPPLAFGRTHVRAPSLFGGFLFGGGGECPTVRMLKEATSGLIAGLSNLQGWPTEVYLNRQFIDMRMISMS